MKYIRRIVPPHPEGIPEQRTQSRGRKRRQAARAAVFALGTAALLLLMAGTTAGRYGSGWPASAAAEETAEAASAERPAEEARVNTAKERATEETAEARDIPAPDFTLADQYGASHTLSAYQGKVVFLNLWTTWCPWCVAEMQDIDDLYHELGENREEVVLLGLASPGGADTADQAGIVSFLEEHGWSYPVLMDEEGTAFRTYITDGYPTTWLVRKDGMLMGYVAGALSKEQMIQLIQMTLAYPGE